MSRVCAHRETCVWRRSVCVFITAGPSTKEYLYEPAADAQRRAGSAGSSAAGPHFSGGGCHGPTAAPAPPGRVRGSPDPPRGALALGGRAASGMRPRRTRKDAPVRQGPAQRDPTFRGGDGLLALNPPSRGVSAHLNGKFVLFGNKRLVNTNN
jgi:hypothetical protein